MNDLRLRPGAGSAPARSCRVLLAFVACLAVGVLAGATWAFGLLGGPARADTLTTPADAAQGDVGTGAAARSGLADGGAPAAPTAPPVPRGSADLSTLAAGAVVAPTRVLIASARIDAAVDPVGIAEDAQMALPPDPDRLGWYQFGPAPGQPTGSAVLAGHVDSRQYGTGQLSRLDRVAVGAAVSVGLAEGSTLSYTVTAVEAVAKRVLPLDMLFARDGSPVLRIVTCGGAYVRGAGYEDNLVVTAVPAATP